MSLPSLNNSRQIGLLEKALESINKALEDARNDLTVDLISVNLFAAYQSILEILGEANQIDLNFLLFPE